MSGKRRGVGYCMNDRCEQFGELRFYADLPSSFDCPTCFLPGMIERERGIRRKSATVFDEVRVEFDFDPLRRIYQQRAAVRDKRLLGRRDVYRLQSPVIRTRAQALRAARGMLSNVSRRLGRPARRRRPTRDQLVSEGWSVLV